MAPNPLTTLRELPSRMFAAVTPVPARKASTGTSYQATGLAPPQVDSETGSSRPVTIRELVPELNTPSQRVIAYGKMMTDAGVDVSMRAAKTPILGAELFVEPYSDDPTDIEIGQFVEANLMEGMNSPFINSLEDILHMYEDGYSILEKVYEMREWSPARKGGNTRNYTMLKKLGIRPASTIKSIEYDNNGGPVKVIQGAIQADNQVKDVDIDISKIIIFSFNKRGGDLSGKSLLRTAHAHWYYKTHFYKIDAIQKERFSLGVLKGKLLPGWTPSDRNILRQLLANYRANEAQFMILTPNVDVEVEFPPGSPVNVLESANHHNTMILLNVLGAFIGLGATSGGGGRATAGTQSDIFMKSLRFVANQIADQINMYLVPELVVWNYPTKNFPKLQVRNIGETRDLQMLGSAISNLFSQKAITWTPETEMWLRKVFDMPTASVDELTKAVAAAAAADAAKTANANAAANAGSNGKGSTQLKPGDAGYVGKPVNASQ